MAFKSVGQKYGFVSAGDVFRQKLAAAEQKVVAAEQKVAAAQQEAADAQRKVAVARQETEADTVTVLREMGLSEEQIAQAQAKLEALQQSRLAK
ncbi:hypothetical protein SAMN05720473_101651 [Fibrobacter sp. UWB15]|uniref:hypothetical protein n=1 Tax=unclassified Fibrobacter TaxID=2634177 RepID=UPI000917D758|nr:MULTISPECIES: hypothetical protein [unclassified Fibrobacter]PWJ67774.1 hypothetical protein BGW99_101651 [Fibrobacter sp. UWB6]SHF77705.1 hypothetical protein SAMN05720760_101616 [Fibrobacter sp. UWB8]SMG15003.1 hypothetical protein SAMN05720473_101651 [Fibrobacter sp. UWB15]